MRSPFEHICTQAKISSCNMHTYDSGPRELVRTFDSYKQRISRVNFYHLIRILVLVSVYDSWCHFLVSWYWMSSTAIFIRIVGLPTPKLKGDTINRIIPMPTSIFVSNGAKQVRVRLSKLILF